MLLAKKIRELRDENGVLQRQLANYFHVDEKELLTLWVADKLLDAVENEDELKQAAIKVAQEEIR